MTRGPTLHRIGHLLTSPDRADRDKGAAELKAAVEEAGSFVAAAQNLGVSIRTMQRWANKAHVNAPQPQRPPIPLDDAVRALEETGSVGAAAERLGVARTTIARRARLAGVEPPDGRRK